MIKVDIEKSDLLIAHIKKNETGEWITHSLEEHLDGVAEKSEKFALQFGNGDWVLGLLHYYMIWARGLQTFKNIYAQKLRKWRNFPDYQNSLSLKQQRKLSFQHLRHVKVSVKRIIFISGYARV